MKDPNIKGLAEVLMVIGAINWGLVGFANLDLVRTLFGSSPALVQLIYILVGLSGLYWLWMEIVAGGKKKKR